MSSRNTRETSAATEKEPLPPTAEPTAVRMKPKARQEWLFARIAAEPGGVVDVCNQDFVFDYIAATGAASRPTMWGAYKCPQLGRDLSGLAQKKYLKRGRTGLWNMGGLGFPRWVWSYRLAPWFVEARGLRDSAGPTERPALPRDAKNQLSPSFPQADER